MFKILFVYLFIIPQVIITSVGCGTYKVITEMALKAEESLFITLESHLGNFEIWTNYKTKTWSIFMIDKNRIMACFKASGKGYKIK